MDKDRVGMEKDREAAVNCLRPHPLIWDSPAAELIVARVQVALERAREEGRQAGKEAEHALSKLSEKGWLSLLQDVRRRWARAMTDLREYARHGATCMRMSYEEGEPTPDGGYREKYGGIWYQARPVDETPECDCGLVNALTAFQTYVEDDLAGRFYLHTWV